MQTLKDILWTFGMPLLAFVCFCLSFYWRTIARFYQRRYHDMANRRRHHTHDLGPCPCRAGEANAKRSR